MAIYHHTTRMIGRSNGGNPVKALAYISGVQLSDERTGEVFDFTDKGVEEVRILLPHNAPEWALKVQKQILENPRVGLQLLSNMVNSAEKRADAQVYREIEFSLPRELTISQNKKLAGEYVQDQFCGLGILAIQSFHVERDEDTGDLNPHCHTFFLTRELVEDGLSFKKNRDWNERSLHETWREQWAQYANFHLKMHGHDITLDHRSYADQGLDIEPQVKLGKGVLSQEKRAKTKEDIKNRKDLGEKYLDHSPAGNGQGESLRSLNDSSLSICSIQEKNGFGFIESVPATERMQELRSVQLRNLYRIMRRPETVFDIVTRHHATFMWGDVQKILGRYVDDHELFQRLDARLKNSKELLLLKVDGLSRVSDPENRINTINGIEDKSKSLDKSTDDSVYTTRGMLRSEKALVGTAEILAGNPTHGVSSSSLEGGLGRMQVNLKKQGFSLSEDQDKAIRHLVGEGQLKCIVGYAGAGKTTALEACREIWESEGYRVYGLAPTGRAAKNLEDSGIASQILHQFLKDFEGGRSQYSDKSVIVLDEAGMVDVERFDKFLGAVKALGVKAVVVGDGAQLQPVEAGPAFRLVTERVGVSRLEEVVRQRQEWQRDATVLFGKQESKAAIQIYQEHGRIHLVEEPLIKGTLPEETQVDDVLRRYEVSTRTSGIIFREIMKEVQNKNLEKNNNSHHPNQYRGVNQHQDYPQFLKWKDIQKDAAREILRNPDVYRGLMEERGLDPLEMARLFVDKKQDKASQYLQAAELLKTKKLDHLIGVERTPGYSVEVRSAAKAALIEDWKKAYHANPNKTLLEGSLVMMSYSNKDVRDLNGQARALLKDSGVIGREDMTYTITREVEDEFGRKAKLKEAREFSKGDRIVFTRNKKSLGVKNGSMGTILSLDKNSIEVALDKDKTFSFSPHLFSFFDQGWAVTIHKSQGTTVDKSFLLISHEMNQNLTYVAMTRHREDVHVYGSTLDFWRPEKVSEVLSKSGEKLGAADYLDAKSLSLLMKEEDRFLTKLFTRLGDELYAMGAVSKQAFGMVADRFLGRSYDDDKAHLKSSMLLKPETLIKEAIREEDRANEILQKTTEKSSKTAPSQDEPSIGPIEKKPEQLEAISDFKDALIQQSSKVNHTLGDVYEDWKHPAFKKADHYKRVFEEGLKLHGEKAAIEYWNEKREPFIKLYGKHLETIEKELHAPILNYLSHESRDLARKAALDDPEKALDLIHQLQNSRQAEKLKTEQLKAEQLKAGQLDRTKESLSQRESVPTPSKFDASQSKDNELREASRAHFRFRDLSYELSQRPHDQELIKEMSEIGRGLFKNKEMFEHIQTIDPKIAKLIKQFGQEKTHEAENQKIRELEKVKEKDYGMSM